MSIITVKDFIEKFDNGDFNSKDCDVQIKAGWFDWFCRDTALANKTKNLAKYIKDISKLGLFDSCKTRVYMKNNCPVYGKLYDSFGLCDMDSGRQILFVSPKLGFNDKDLLNKVEIYNENDKQLLFNSWDEALLYLAENGI